MRTLVPALAVVLFLSACGADDDLATAYAGSCTNDVVLRVDAASGLILRDDDLNAVATLADGSSVEVVDGWVTFDDGVPRHRVRQGEQTGWVVAEYTRFEATPGLVEVSEGVRLRGGRTLKSEILTAVPDGARVEVLDWQPSADPQDNQYHWHQVRWGENLGWVATDQVSLTGLLLDCPGTIEPSTDERSEQEQELQAIIDELGTICEQYAPGLTCGIAVQDLSTGARAAHRGATEIVSASSAKAIWIAAGLHDVGVDRVAPYAWDTFAISDDFAPAFVMDMLASYDRVNTFMWNEAGMADSAYCSWHRRADGGSRRPSNCPGALGVDNYFTASDVVTFLSRVWSNKLFADQRKTDALLEWMTWSPQSGFAAGIGTQLPPSVQPTIHHKPGWLAPNHHPGYSVSNEIGIVELGDGRAYAVATLLSGPANEAQHYDRQLPMMEFASCVIYMSMVESANPFADCRLP